MTISPPSASTTSGTTREVILLQTMVAPGSRASSWLAIIAVIVVGRLLLNRLYRLVAATGVRDVKVPSTDPAVLAVAAGDTGYTELLSLDGKGMNRATIRLQNGQYVGECTDETDYLLIDDCPTMPDGGGQVFLRSKDSDDALHPSNWIVGFDLV